VRAAGSEEWRPRAQYSRERKVAYSWLVLNAVTGPSCSVSAAACLLISSSGHGENLLFGPGGRLVLRFDRCDLCPPLTDSGGCLLEMRHGEWALLILGIREDRTFRRSNSVLNVYGSFSGGAI
jgi:hypothetical protein